MGERKKIAWLIKKEWVSLQRHPARLFSILAFPIIMILLFGYGMGGELTDLPVIVVSQSEGELTDQTIDILKDTNIYKVVEVTDDVELAKEKVDSGEVKGAIILPKNYEEMTEEKEVTFYLDSSDQMASQVLIPTTEGIFQQIAIGESLKLSSVASGMGASSDSPLAGGLDSIKSLINVDIYKIYGDIKYIDFLVPAVLGMTIMMSCMMGMGASIAGERETGELARLFMTPTTVATVITGKILGKLSVELIRAMILLFAAIILFGAVVKGGILQTIFVLMIGALCFVGFGIMMSSRASNQEDYSQMVMPLSMPMMFVSGVFYPIETMPWIFQKLAYIFPLTYLNDAMRGIMLKGQGLGDIWFELAILCLFTLVFFIVGVKQFDRDV